MSKKFFNPSIKKEWISLRILQIVLIFFLFSLKFIVVSLKEGMFNNANVLFKTKFVDGVSTVARFTQCQNGKVPKETKSKAKGPKWSSHEEVKCTDLFLYLDLFFKQTF